MRLVVLVTPEANRTLIHRHLGEGAFAATILEATAHGQGGRWATVLMAVEEERAEATVEFLRGLIKEGKAAGESELFLLPLHHFTKT